MSQVASVLGVFWLLGLMLYAIRATAYESGRGDSTDFFLIVFWFILSAMFLFLYFFPEILACH